MNNAESLSSYFENNRPSIQDLLNIYITVLECVNNDNAKGVIFHMDYIKYEPSTGKVYLPVNRNKQGAFNLMDFFCNIQMTLKYSDIKSKKLADSVIKVYNDNGCNVCLDMLKEYKENIYRENRIITFDNLMFIIVIILIISIFYGVYGISFF